MSDYHLRIEHLKERMENGKWGIQAKFVDEVRLKMLLCKDWVIFF